MLDAEHFQATRALKNDCSTFMGKMAELNSLVQTYLEVLDKQVGMTLFEEMKASCRSVMAQTAATQPCRGATSKPECSALLPSPQQAGNCDLLSAGSKN